MYACENEERNLKNETSVTVRPLSKIVAPSIKHVELKNGELQPSDEILLDSRLLDGDSSNSLFVKQLLIALLWIRLLNKSVMASG